MNGALCCHGESEVVWLKWLMLKEKSSGSKREKFWTKERRRCQSHRERLTTYRCPVSSPRKDDDNCNNGLYGLEKAGATNIMGIVGLSRCIMTQSLI